MATLTGINTQKEILSSVEDLSATTPVEEPTPTETNDDPEGMSEDEKKRIMRMIEQEDSSDDEDDDSN